MSLASLSDLFRLLPPYPEILGYALVAGAAILVSGSLAGALKRFARWKTGYTRKVLHFLIFSTAVVLHMWGGMPAVNVLGAGMGLFVLLAVRSGAGNFFFEGMAREKDAPRRGYFVIVPYVMTALGGVVSNFLFGGSAVMGYALCGTADAVAEPVGVRFGKHPYRVPTLRSVRSAERTLEGSAAVFVVSLLLSLGFFVSLYGIPFAKAVLASFILSAALVVVEALSFHGADNLTVQVAASGLTFLFLRLWGSPPTF